MCGKNQRSNIVGNFTLGSPPRVREKHIVNDNYKFKRGITPACAGKTKRQRSISLVRVDHPRVCGKNQKNLIYSPIIQGSPPRVREKLVLFPCLRRGCGITPACAGKTWGRSDSPQWCRDHPRVCGKNAYAWEAIDIGIGSPPRVREKH